MININKIKINKKANSLGDQKAARIRVMKKNDMASKKDIEWLKKYDEKK